MNKIWLKIAVGFAPLLLVACTPTPATSVVTTHEGVLGALEALVKSKSVQLTFQMESESGAKGLAYHTTYRPNYVYSDDPGKEWGYIQSDDGVYSLGANDDYEIVPGEILKKNNEAVASLWDADLFPYFTDFDLREFPESDSYSLGNKINIMATMDLFGISRTRYLDVGAVTVTAGATWSDFSLRLVLGPAVYVCTVSGWDVPSTDVEDFLKAGGKAYIPDTALIEMRDLFEADNYNRDVRDYSDPTVSLGTEHFTPEYFYGDYVPGSGAASSGIMSIKKQTLLNPSTGQNVSLNGCYYFTIQNNQVVPTLGRAYNASSDIASVCFYLHHPLLFDRFQYVANNNGIYTTSKQEVLKDFATNNQVASIISEAGYSLYRLDFTIDNPSSDKEVVTFDLYFGTAEDNLGFVRYVFQDFGKANLSVVDKFMDQYFPNR